MHAQEQMRYGARILAAIFGGPGIFYLYLSFQRPDMAFTAVIYLLIAVALSFYAGEGAEQPGAVRALALCRSVIRSAKRRR